MVVPYGYSNLRRYALQEVMSDGLVMNEYGEYVEVHSFGGRDTLSFEMQFSAQF